MLNTMNATISHATIVAPTGVEATIEMQSPRSVHTSEIATELIVTILKLLKTLIAETLGNITSAEIRSEPTKFIAITIITAIKTAISKL